MLISTATTEPSLLSSSVSKVVSKPIGTVDARSINPGVGSREDMFFPISSSVVKPLSFSAALLAFVIMTSFIDSSTWETHMPS